MDKTVEEKLAGRTPLVLAIRDVPRSGETTVPFVILLEPFATQLNVATVGTIKTTGFLMTRQQAIEITTRLTSLLMTSNSATD
jgi:hypothetical protein